MCIGFEQSVYIHYMQVCVEEWFVLGVDKLKSSAERSDRDTRVGVGVVLVNWWPLFVGL